MIRFRESVNVDKVYEGNIPPVCSSNISVIIPVKNNQAGIDRFLSVFFDVIQEHEFPKEIIIVDNNSKIRIQIQEHISIGWKVPIRILHCTTPGPAAARNMGVRNALGDWLLFCDSDCIPTPSTIFGYMKVKDKAIAYAGDVKGWPRSRLSKFYDSENVLLPRTRVNSNGRTVPIYIVTANALVWKKALVESGYFDEYFDDAAGEDVEVTRRLWLFGNIELCKESMVLHDFSDGLIGFLKRFLRYGGGNRKIEITQGINMKPKFSRPRVPTTANYIGKYFQYLFMRLGYLQEKYRVRNGADIN